MIDLGSIVNLGSTDISSGILEFFSIPMVGAVLMLFAALALSPMLIRVVVRLFVWNPEGPRWKQIASELPGLDIYDCEDGHGFATDSVSGDDIEWHVSYPFELDEAGGSY